MKLIRSKNKKKLPDEIKKEVKTEPRSHDLKDSMRTQGSVADLDSNNWKVLIVNDEPDVHEITRIGLKGFSFDGKKLELVSAYSAEQAREILQNDQDFAAALIDVVMETEEAGLDLVRFIREEMELLDIRLIIRTGHPGKAPQRFVIDNFDIDDYKEKTDLTTLKMYTMLRNSIKSYRDILISERNRVELEQKVHLEKTHKKLKELAIKLERAARVKSEFLASMSHELRTPLNAIIGFSQVLQDQDFGPLNEKQKEYMLDILESGNHLLSLIDDILDISKIEAGKMELKLSPVVVGDLLVGSLVIIQEKAMNHGITLKTDIPEELSPFVMLADERKFKQILFNLLSNASKFTPDNGVITLSARRMAVGEGEVIQVSVKDTGIGITPENKGKVFESFYQISSSLTNKTSGTGLGLPLAKSFVKLHGGRMWMESEGVGKGSQFYFTLPVQPVLPEIGKHLILHNHLKRFISFSKRHSQTFALCFLYMKGDDLQLKIHKIDGIMERNKRAYDFSLLEDEEGMISLLLQDIDQDSARMICERIVIDIESEFETFEISFSLVSYPSDGDKPETLLEKMKTVTRYQTSTYSGQVKGK